MLVSLFKGDPVFALSLLVFTFFGLLHIGQSSSVLLSSTLNTFQESSCDGEEMKMKCPKGSLVSIQFAQYGRQVPSSQMCPYRINANGSTSPLKQYSGRVAVWEDTNCLATTSLQVILNNCQDRQHCHLVASTTTFQQDPCPGTGKYLEVAYKCRPNEFKSETVCEGEQLKLWCRKSTRIVIFSSLFGRTPGGNSQCPGTLPEFAANRTNCQSRIASEEVMKHCHGNKKCTLDAEESVFGNPCPQGVQKYLNVVYTCVPRKVLIPIRRHNGQHHRKKTHTTTQNSPNIPILPDKVLLQTTKAPSKPEEFPQDAAQQPGLGESRQKPEGTVTQPEKPRTPANPDKEVKLAGGSREPTTPCPNTTAAVGSSQGEPAATGLLIDWFNAFNFIKKNREKAVLYLVLGMAAGLICILLLVIVRLAIVNKRHSRAKLDVSEPIHEDHPPPPIHMDAPTSTLERTESIDRIEVVRFSPRPRDYGTCTLRSDIGNRSLTNYYG